MARRSAVRKIPSFRAREFVKMRIKVIGRLADAVFDSALSARERSCARSFFAFAPHGRGFNFGERDERVAIFMQFGDEQGEEIGEPF